MRMRMRVRNAHAHSDAVHSMYGKELSAPAWSCFLLETDTDTAILVNFVQMLIKTVLFYALQSISCFASTITLSQNYQL